MILAFNNKVITKNNVAMNWSGQVDPEEIVYYSDTADHWYQCPMPGSGGPIAGPVFQNESYTFSNYLDISYTISTGVPAKAASDNGVYFQFNDGSKICNRCFGPAGPSSLNPPHHRFYFSIMTDPKSVIETNNLREFDNKSHYDLGSHTYNLLNTEWHANDPYLPPVHTGQLRMHYVISTDGTVYCYVNDVLRMICKISDNVSSLNKMWMGAWNTETTTTSDRVTRISIYDITIKAIKHFNP